MIHMDLTFTENFEFVGSKNEKVGDDTTAEARRVMQPNQVGQIKNFFQTFRKSHFHGRWSYSSGAQPRAGSGSKSEISQNFVTICVPDVRIPTSKFS